MAIFAAVFLVVTPLLFLGKDAGVDRALWIALLATAGVFLLGLLDDVIDLHRSQYKLMMLLAAAFAVCWEGFSLDSLSIGGHVIQLGMAAWPVSFLWIVGVTTAVNFIDGLDGLAAGISAVTAATIALVAVVGNQPAIAVIALGLTGSLCGFLFFNFNPARVFMGDCGSMFLGFTLATVSLICAAARE